MLRRRLPPAASNPESDLEGLKYRRQRRLIERELTDTGASGSAPFLPLAEHERDSCDNARERLRLLGENTGRRSRIIARCDFEEKARVIGRLKR